MPCRHSEEEWETEGEEEEEWEEEEWQNNGEEEKGKEESEKREMSENRIRQVARFSLFSHLFFHPFISVCARELRYACSTVCSFSQANVQSSPVEVEMCFKTVSSLKY